MPGPGSQCINYAVRICAQGSLNPKHTLIHPALHNWSLIILEADEGIGTERDGSPFTAPSHTRMNLLHKNVDKQQVQMNTLGSHVLGKSSR